MYESLSSLARDISDKLVVSSAGPTFRARILLGLASVYQRARGFERLRRHAISKASAVWFIILILLPVTAPFPSYQFQHSSDGFPIEATPKDLKGKIGADDELAVPSGWSLVSPAPIVVMAPYSPLLECSGGHRPSHAVLRL
jgi:hypothetical protein